MIAPELLTNNLASLPGAIYATEAKSPIHWQAWSKESMERAREAKRLIFAVIAMPQYPGYQTVLSALAEDPKVVTRINEIYVPILIDGEASREIGLLTADLCAEIKRGLQLPLFVWMTADGNPVAWITAPASQLDRVSALFTQSDFMVSGMWEGDLAYVMKNSELDNIARQKRIAKRRNVEVKSEQPAVDVIRAIRQLISFYDPVSRSFDEAGGLFPAGSLDLLSTAAIHPGIPPDLRAKCLAMTKNLLSDLLGTAMFDPLEGGVFISRRGPSWGLPVWNRDCLTQARAAVALLNSYRATGDALALERALGIISYSEKYLRTPDGLFAIGLNKDIPAGKWLWTTEEIQSLLPAEDAAWWISITGMKELGNLPSEADPNREFFRGNSLAFSKSIAAMATAGATTPEAITTRLGAVRSKLIEARQKKIGMTPRDGSSHAGATFRMVSAYASAFAATGDESFRDKAVALQQKARAAFAQGPRLRTFALKVPDAINEGRAFLYGLALQATLDLAAISDAPSNLAWAEDIATTAAELFTDAEFLKECPDSAKILDLPITDLAMLFDDSTAGLISMAECRLAETQRPLVASFSQLATPLPVYSMKQPVLHTDILQATLARHFKVTIIAGKELPAELKLATQRLPLRMVQRRPAAPADGIPAGAVMVISPEAEPRLVTTAKQLEQAVLPAP